MDDGGDSSLYANSVVERKEVGGEVRLVFGDEQIGSDASDSAWYSNWSKFLWVVYIFVKCNKVDGIDVGAFVVAVICICDVGEECC